MLKFFKKVPDAFAFLLVVSLMAGFSIGELPDSPDNQKTDQQRSTILEFIQQFVRNDAEIGGSNFYIFFAIVAVVLLILPSSILLISRKLTGSYERAGRWLRFLWASFLAAFVMLVLKVLIYDQVLKDLHMFSTFDDGLKDIFSFSLTLYAFVAGFILFYCLQEYSNISKDFKQELGAWHAMFDLLRFFEKRKGDKVKPGFKEQVDENHNASTEGRKQISAIDPATMISTGDPEAGLNQVFKTLLRFTVVDDNDQPALDALIQKYSVLRILLHQRKERSVKSPSMLVFVVWVVAIINIVLASLAVLSLFEFCDPKNIDLMTNSTCENGPVQALQRLVLSILISVIVLPIMMINLTIYDLRNPFDGDWKIDVEKEYMELFAQLKDALEDTQAEPENPDVAGT